MITVPLTAFLVVAAILFATGLYAIIAQRTAVMVLMGIELLLNAIGLNLVAFWRFTAPHDYSGQIFVIIIVTLGAIEMSIGLGLMMLLYRRHQTVQVDKYADLKG
jgi:NADH-quinone oxidoreductase subunit K/NAD(P)H-quinone oxidoreductase subunit 4L